MIESILELPPWQPSAGTGTITTAASSDAVVGVGTDFDPEVTVDDLISWTDDAGVLRIGMVKTVTDDTNIVLYDDAVSVATGVAFSILGPTSVPWFVANSANFKSPIINCVEGVGVFGAQDASLINSNEGVFIKSIYMRFPYQYTMADTPIALALSYFDNASPGIRQGPITTVGEDGIFMMTRENNEIPVNAYVPPQSGASTYQIGVTISGALDDPEGTINPHRTAQVSQINGPSDLDNIVLPIYIGIRVVHAAEAII